MEALLHPINDTFTYENREPQQSILCIGPGLEMISTSWASLGYSTFRVSTLAMAQSEIQERLQTGKTLPCAIIGNAALSQTELEDFADFLGTQEVLSSIPFILFTHEESLITKNKAAAIDGVDDIYFPNMKLKDMQERIQFLQSFKQKREYFKQKYTRKLPKVELTTQQKTGRFFKRALDILVASAGLIALSPLFIIIALLIKLESKGPVFYISKRAGSGYKVFDFYKFRTMRQDADKLVQQMKHLNQYSEESQEEDGPMFFKISNDPRVTRVGAFLRDSSLDEIPQLLNILKGDMSLVGNRPLPLYEAKELTKDEWAKRFAAPAGLTGLWQVTKRGKKEMSALERVQLDIQYAKYNSFVGDMKIIAKTFPALVQKESV
ncbi:sugar transferase [Rapidithrix thailandica]|uniref:Sugar transferase n=1 Tax=Rapidithrix thailandica TaxID=413964 RepID=A0AAW9S6B1_9BACT